MPRRAMKIIPKQIVRNCEPFPEREIKQRTLSFHLFTMRRFYERLIYSRIYWKVMFLTAEA